MNPELIKQAYAYGAAVALQELGFSAQQAQAGGVKLASEKMAEGEEERDPALWPAAMFGPVGAAIAAPEGKGTSAFGRTLGGQTLGMLGGGTAGAGLGAGVGALAGLLSRGKFRPGQGALIGGLGGGYLGMGGGGMYGAAKGYQSALNKEE